MAGAAAKRAVIRIEPKANFSYGNTPNVERARRRVAAYARVSTDSEEQLTSYNAQLDYYTRLINSNDAWELVEVYPDEGVSGVSTKKREGFNRMIQDALGGKIDLIITKSVSRFARNTVDTLTTVRQLKAAGVEVYFEKENIYTLDSKGELLITIMSSLAQEESRSISENVTWGKRKQFADGKVTLPYKQFLGYRKGANGLPEIVEEEAETVRLIYRLFLFGKTPSAIASMLTAEGILSPGGKPHWRPNTVESILTNEKYKGHALLQKSYTVDFLTKKQKVNTGQVPQYYVENSHPAIIEPEMFDHVQWEIKQRKASGYGASTSHTFSGKLFCGECGNLYGSKVWNAGSKYRRSVWVCNNRHRSKCGAPHLTEERVQSAFLEVINQLVGNRADILDAYRDILQELTDISALDTEAADLQTECEFAVDMSRKLIQENASAALDQEDYSQRFDALNRRYETARSRLAEIEAMRQERTAKRVQVERYMRSLAECGDFVKDFDEELWYTTVDKAFVYGDGRMAFKFRDGSSVMVAVK